MLVRGTVRTPLDPSAASPVVFETDRVGFELQGADAVGLDGQWRIRLGDILPENAYGRAFGPVVAWERAFWFDCCRGPVEVSFEFLADSGDEGSGPDLPAPWTPLLAATVAVAPSKVGEDAWQAMRADLVAVAADLASDLLGRASHGRKVAVGARSTLDTLRAAGQALPRLEATLRAIAEQPHAALSRVADRPAVAARRIDAKAIAHLLRAGIDPRRTPRSRTPRVPSTRLRPNLDTPEHRALAGCLDALREAARTSASRARTEADETEADRRWRDLRSGSNPSLYEQYDAPRIARLRTAELEAAELADRAAGLRRAPPLQAVRRTGSLAPSLVFSNVPAYAAAFRAMLRWQEEGGVEVEGGANMRRKDTARMYEQWVFLQLAAALREAGLAAENADDVLRRVGSRRLLADLHRGATLTYRHGRGCLVSLSYEPWIRPKQAAAELGDPLYRGTSGEAAWSPDVLLALHKDGRVGRPDAAFVVDAKYVRHLLDGHWDRTAKYSQIRRTADGTQAVRQVWLAFPGDGTIGLRDEAVSWTESGPDGPNTDSLQGYVGMAPLAGKPVGAPVPAAVAFVAGMLRHSGLDVPEATTP